MSSRRDFLAAGIGFVGCSLMGGVARAQGARRTVTLGGRRLKVIDMHAHCVIPEALEIAGIKIGQGAQRPDLALPATLTERLAAMDAQGIDVEALSINAFWYGQDRDRAARICEIQNEKLAELVASKPDRFVAFATVALQFPDLAVEQLTAALKKQGLRGVAVGGSVEGTDLSDPRFHPFWAKVEELGVTVFMHPQSTPGTVTHTLRERLKGNGRLDNIIGLPAETTIFLEKLIFDGTLDRFPKLKIVASHGGGFLPSYAARQDRGCATTPAACPGGPHGAIRKAPSEYLKQLYYDTMVFTDEGLRHLAAEVGASQLVIGTDHPFPWTTTAVDHVLKSPHLSDAEKAQILEGTAARLLGLNT